jgi:hypothetical protein
VKLTDPILTYTNADSPKVDKAEGPVGTVVVGGATYRGSTFRISRPGLRLRSYSGDFEGTPGSLSSVRADSRQRDGLELYRIDLGGDAGHFVPARGRRRQRRDLRPRERHGVPSGTTGAVYRLVAGQ